VIVNADNQNQKFYGSSAKVNRLSHRNIIHKINPKYISRTERKKIEGSFDGDKPVSPKGTPLKEKSEKFFHANERAKKGRKTEAKERKIGHPTSDGITTGKKNGPRRFGGKWISTSTSTKHSDNDETKRFTINLR